MPPAKKSWEVLGTEKNQGSPIIPKTCNHGLQINVDGVSHDVPTFQKTKLHRRHDFIDNGFHHATISVGNEHIVGLINESGLVLLAL